MMSSAVQIILSLAKELSEAEMKELVNELMLKELVVDAKAAVSYAAAPAPAKGRLGRVGRKAMPFWTKTVEKIDDKSVNAHGAEGKWGVDGAFGRPVLIGLNKPRHLYAVAEAAPGEIGVVRDDDGFEVEVRDVRVVMTSKDWEEVKQELARRL